MKDSLFSIGFDVLWMNEQFYIVKIDFKDNPHFISRDFSWADPLEPIEKMIEYLLINDLLWQKQEKK